MWTSREKIKHSLTAFWLALAAAMLLAMQLTPSFSAPVVSADASDGGCRTPAARVAIYSAGPDGEDAG